MLFGDIMTNTESHKNIAGSSSKMAFADNDFANLKTAQNNKPKSHIAKHTKENKNKIKPLTDKQKQKLFKVLAIIGCCLAGIYLIGVIFFNFFTYPNTSAADADLSFKTSSAVKDTLTKQSSNYVLDIDAFGDNYKINGSSIDYEFDADQATKRIYKLQNALLWPYEIFLQHNFTDDNLANFNNEKLEPQITKIIEDHNSRAIAPANAGFVVDVQSKSATQKDEVVGTTLDAAKTSAEIHKKINSASRNCTLNENSQVLPQVVSSNSKYPNSLAQANKALNSVINLTMGTSSVGTFDCTVFGQWLEINPDYTTTINYDKTYEWSSNFSKDHSTVGATRTYTSPSGKTSTVTGGTYGWKVDTSELCSTLKENSVTGTVQNIEVPCSSSAKSYQPGGKDWGSRYIDVDLSSQHATMYGDDGNVIWSSAFVSGKPDGHQTPTGVWTILYKESPAMLRPQEADHATKVQYWMPFTSDGVGLHDATWQSSFGGSRYIEFGSHGCLNLPYNSAQSLYSLVKSGDVVVVHN